MGLLDQFIDKARTKIDSHGYGHSMNQNQNQNQNQGPGQAQAQAQAQGQSNSMYYNRPAMPLPPSQQPQPQPQRPSGPPPSHHQQQQVFHDSNDIFQSPINSIEPTRLFQSANHPVPLPHGTHNSTPIQTNSFYTNLLLDDQTAPVWTHPYSVWYTTNKADENEYFGLAIAHTTMDQRVFGENPNIPGQTQYFFNPAGIKSFILGAEGFDKQSMNLQLTNCEKFNCDVIMSSNQEGFLKVPLVQGMGFITGIYTNLTPKISSAVGIANFQKDTKFSSSSHQITKYIVTLFNQVNWSMYVSGNGSDSFQLRSSNEIIGGSGSGSCTVQLASGLNQAYDFAAGNFPTACHISATVNGSNATYNLNYQVEGAGNTVIYALPHQVEAFTEETQRQMVQDLKLDSTIAGSMCAVLTKKLSMNEILPIDIGFEPGNFSNGEEQRSFTQSQSTSIRNACLREIEDDVINMSNTDSMYSSGKILDKYAMILYVIVFILKDQDLGQFYLPKLKNAMNRFTTNKQQCPLVYDQTWKGIISSAGLDGNIFKDFGNTHYNDHHFHYGYHIHAASIVALCDNTIGDGSFMKQNKEYYNLLIKDVANPLSNDPFLPQSRSFDWYNGHSWAKGLFSSFDGKDEESSSEDYHFAYGMKLWGIIINDDHLKNRAELMLAIMRRSMQLYMLYKDDNPIQPRQIIANRVSGILFENKIDHATYFGLNLEYIQGIHMLPITPISSFIRDAEFVRQEWESLKLGQHASTLTDGWKGILMLNLAIYDANTSWNFFNDSHFNMNWLDNGMSLTWSLAYSASMMI